LAFRKRTRTPLGLDDRFINQPKVVGAGVIELSRGHHRVPAFDVALTG